MYVCIRSGDGGVTNTTAVQGKGSASNARLLMAEFTYSYLLQKVVRGERGGSEMGGTGGTATHDPRWWRRGLRETRPFDNVSSVDSPGVHWRS